MDGERQGVGSREGISLDIILKLCKNHNWKKTVGLKRLLKVLKLLEPGIIPQTNLGRNRIASAGEHLAPKSWHPRKLQMWDPGCP